MDFHDEFKDKVVLVTGAGRGIGLAIARSFAQHGAAVLFNVRRNRETADRVVREINQSGGRAEVWVADACLGEDVSSMVDHIQSSLGGLHILINNAGSYPVAPLLDIDLAQWEEVISSNLRAPFLCTQAAARIMKAHDGGVIVNIGSIEGSFPALNHAHYNAAKAGLLHFTRSAARELGRYGIRVNAVSPGLIDRPGLAADWPEGVSRWQESTPLHRLGRAEDIANACLFLASEAAAWITGTNLVVDGGASTTPAF